MQSQRFEALVGLIVLVLAGFFLFVILQNTRGNTIGDSYKLSAAFSSAEGISAGSPVRMAGVPIGKVDGLTLDPDSYSAVVDFVISGDVAIPADSEVKVASDGLLGGAFIEIVPGADEIVLAQGDSFAYTNGAVSLLNLFAAFATGGAEE